MNIKDLFSQFDQLKVLIIGDVMLDSYLWGKVERISPEAPVPVVNVQKREIRLGGAGNVALNLLSLGANPILCSVIGKDTDGDSFLKLLEKHNLEKCGIIQSAERPTTIKHRIIAGSQQMLRIDSETDKLINEDLNQQLLARILVQLEGCQVVIFEDYDKGIISEWLIREVVRVTNEKGIPTVVDPKKRNFLFYEGVTLFKPNLKELKEGLKIDFDKADKNEVIKASDLLRKKLNIKSTLITLSEYGIFASDDTNNHFIPAHLRTISDVSGAGDTVVSVAAMALAVNLPLNQIAELSNLAGGIVCEYVGVVPIDKERLEKEAASLFD